MKQFSSPIRFAGLYFSSIGDAINKAMEWKGKIAKDAERNLRRRIGSKRWLKQSKIFDHSLKLKGDYKDVCKRLFDEIIDVKGQKKIEQKLIDFEILIANLINSFNSRFKLHKRPISISRNSHSWTKNRYKKASPFTIELIKILEEKGMIEVRNGYYDRKQVVNQKRTNRSFNTRIWATENLIERFPVYNNNVISEPVSLIELKDKNGNLKDFRLNKKANQIEKILKKANQVNSNAVIIQNGYRLHTNLIAIFIEDFNNYGRLHTRGFRHHQLLSKDERKEIRINGNSVTELDYSGLHPNLLYAFEGIQYEGNPYSIINHNRPEVKKYLKFVLLCMINCNSEQEAIKVANMELHKFNKKKGEDQMVLQDLGINSPIPLIEELKRVHQPISHHFFNGKKTGLKLMYHDSSIALDVIKYFASRNIPILPIHDSFVVEEMYEETLRGIMLKSYQKHTKGYEIIIK